MFGATATRLREDAAWRRVWYDLSALADGQASIYVRWGHQVASRGPWRCSGWNVDDIEILGTPTRFLNVLVPGVVAETAGVLPNAGLLRTAAPLSTNLVVSLSSSAPGRLQVPAAVTIPAGQVSATFNLTATDNAVHDGDLVVTITASAPALAVVSTSVNVADDDLPPAIVLQPASRSIPAGSNVTFSVVATGKAPLSYFWHRNGTPMAGATSSSFTTNNVRVADSGTQFSCLVSNRLGTQLSSTATLTVLTGVVDLVTFDDLDVESIPAGYHDVVWNNLFVLDATSTGANGYRDGMVSPPNIAFNGYGDEASLSNNVPFHVISTYATAAWNQGLQLNIKGYVGQTLVYDNTYTLSATNPTWINLGLLGVTRVEFESWGGTPYYADGSHFVLDDMALLATPVGPGITRQPASVAVEPAESATFMVDAGGTGPLSYYWRRNGTPITGATESSYTLNDVQAGDAGARFSCLVSNAYGMAVSSNAVLGVASMVYAFNGTEGGNPYSALIQARDGNFYGTTMYGGANGYGTIFRRTPNGVVTTLLSFDYANGAYPLAGLIEALDGGLYGTTASGGPNQYGTVFRIGTDRVLTTLYGFSYEDGYYPQADLTQGKDGKLYGATLYGGRFSRGNVFSVTTNGSWSVLASFDTTNGALLLQSPASAFQRGSLRDSVRWRPE